MIEHILRRERQSPALSQACFWRTAASAAIDLLIERGPERVTIECKAGRGDPARALRTLRDALAGVQATRAWIVDQAAIKAVGAGIARAGFGQVLQGWP